MQTIDVPQREWPQMLADFSLAHDRWPISIEVLWPDMGAQSQLIDLPLLGVTAELGVPEQLIVIAAGHDDGEYVSHVIHDPIRVLLARTDDGDDAALEIVSEGGAVNIVRLRAAAELENVDEGRPPG